MKQGGIFILLFIMTTVLLSACGGKTVEVSDYLKVSFDGKDTAGTASYHIDTAQMIEDLYGIDPAGFEGEMGKLREKDTKKYQEIMDVLNGYYYEVEQETELSNGDTFVIELGVREEAEKRLKGSTEKIEVEGLEPLTELTSEEVEKHVIVDFTGASSKGMSRIENTLSGELGSLQFTVENEGALSNGDEAVLTIDDDSKHSLVQYGYKLAEDFNVTYEVHGLDVYAEKGSDINNLPDVKRMIKEEMSRSFEEDPGYDFARRYTYEEEVTLYRQFADEDNSSNNGSFIVLYRVNEYNNKDDFDNDKTSRSYIYSIGYTNLMLNDDNKVNVSDMQKTTDRKDDSYSLETIQQIYEGNGYGVVNTKSKDEEKE